MIKTVTLTGTELEVSDLGGQNVAVKNLGDGSIYASPYPNVVAGADNVVEIPAGGGEVVLDANGTVYLLGTGKAQCTGTSYATPNFKMPSSSTGGGGESESNPQSICGVFESVEPIIETVTVQAIPDRNKTIASTIAEHTGWDLQNDGVTVLNDEKSGFRFTSNYCWLVNKNHYDTDYYNYGSGLSDNFVMDFCKSKSGDVVFGIRGSINANPCLQFAMVKNAVDELSSLTTYTTGIHYISENDATVSVLKQTAAPIRPDNESNVWLEPMADLVNGGFFKNIFIVRSLYDNNLNQSGTQIVVNGKRFVLFYNRVYYSTEIRLAVLLD